MTTQIADAMVRFSGPLEGLSDEMQRELFDRSSDVDPEIALATRTIIQRVKATGDDALRELAMKLLRWEYIDDDRVRARFLAEAQITAKLQHPGIVAVHDRGELEDGRLWYTMKVVDGRTLGAVIHEVHAAAGPDGFRATASGWTFRRLVDAFARISQAVGYAHSCEVMHRDLKPENIMTGTFGEVLVMDWGLARITAAFANADAVFQADNLGGTPAYMAPEMARGPVEAINTTSDIYLLGAMLYEIIGGKPPHSGRDVMQCLMAASQNRIDPIRYDGELKNIALKAMATEQRDRYQSVKEFQEAIRLYQAHSESLVLTAHANQNLQKARESNDYALFARAKERRINLRYVDADHLGISFDQSTRREELTRLLTVFKTDAREQFDIEAADKSIKETIPKSLARTSSYLTHPVFEMYHSETEC